MEPGSKADELAEVHGLAHRRAERTRMASSHRAQARIRAGRNRARPLARARGGSRACRWKHFSKSPRTSNRRKVIGRFSTFLEHVKPLKTGERVTKYNALFHWAVPPGREIEAGREVGRHSTS